eukprot:scaffold169251_cov17-Tisochrysis_lutea.AAC.1
MPVAWMGSHTGWPGSTSVRKMDGVNSAGKRCREPQHENPHNCNPMEAIGMQKEKAVRQLCGSSFQLIG